MSAATAWLAGAGPPVALIHGFGADRLSWAATVPALAGARALHAVELPGHGQAGAVPDPATPEALAREVARAVAPLGPLPVIGHSLGGAVALHLAAQRPDLVTRLVLIAPAGWGRGLDATFLRELPRAEDAETLQRVLERLVVQTRHIPPGLAAHLLTELDTRRAGLARIAEAVLAAPPPPVPEVPAAVIWGAEDAVNPRDPARALPDLHLVDGAGHLPHVEKAARVNRLIADALL
jgi:pyruvate dehydrogenase E2 component (dihydrolipoamide acetyltransferase)